MNRIESQLYVQAPTRQGPHPERDAARNIAALMAMCCLSERYGLEPVTRNPTQKRIWVPEACFEGGSVCDAVGAAMGRNYQNGHRIVMNYQNARRIFTGRRKLILRHPLLFMTPLG